MGSSQQHIHQRTIIMYRVIFENDPAYGIHLFENLVQADRMLGRSPGRVTKVAVREVETMVYQERGR